VALPPGLPAAFTEPVDDPLADLVSRYARTHGPFTVTQAAHRLGAPRERVQAALLHLARQDRLVEGAFRPDGAEREWCDTNVLRRLKRRSLAALRRDVEPVDGATYARFLLSWHGVTGPPRRGPDALAETIAQLQGVAIPASALETDILPARTDVYRPADLDLLLASGDLVWFGAGSIGATDGRVVLAYRDAAAALAPAPDSGHLTSEVHESIRHHLATAGASFWPQILSAVGIGDETLVLDALWDLVWAGEVTNDGMAALRSLRSRGRGGAGSRGRARPGRVRRSGPAHAAGRWSLTAAIREPAVTETARAHAIAEQLLERHGVVTAEGARAEGVPGGFASVYPVLKAMEEVGTVRRGYVVEGLGGAQFSTPGVVDRLRTHREGGDDVVVLAATDPAQPYGAALAWPESPGRPSRSAGSLVVLEDGAPVLFVERSGRSLVTFATTDTVRHAAHLTAIVTSGRRRRLQIARVDGVEVHDTAWPAHLVRAGFVTEPRGLVLRPR
jgi:ATP-dependent Lhr-like helicase